MQASSARTRTTWRRLGAVLLTASALIAVTAGAQAGAARDEVAADPLRIYVAPDGSADNTGLTPHSPVRTLDDAEARIPSTLTTDVEVRLEPGTYAGAAKTTWSTYPVGHKVSFLPTTYTVGEGSPGALPVFTGPTGSANRSKGSSWFSASAPRRHLTADEGLRFYYIEVRNYASGLTFMGDTTVDPTTKLRKAGRFGNDHHTVWGMKFVNLGDKHNWNGAALDTEVNTRGTHAISLTNSSHNEFFRNHFINLEGVENTKTPALEIEVIHAFYVKDGSTANEIHGNSFRVISGSPLKFRNNASNNRLHHNRFSLAGTASDGVAYDRIERFPCMRTGYPKGCKTQTYYECPSHGNVVEFNTLRAKLVNGTKRVAGYRWVATPLVVSSPYKTTERGKSGCPVRNPWMTWGSNEYVVP